MEQTPLVSILINNYNYGRFLSDAIASALDQDYPQIEVVVVDDGSTDHSPEVIESYGDRIVPVLKANGGQASAFNAGLKASRGEILCILDADDWFMPDKLTKIVEVFRQFPDIGWCFHRLRFVESETRELLRLSTQAGTQYWDLRKTVQRRGRLPFTSPATSGLCFRRSLLSQILPMPEAKDVTISDLYLKTAAVALSPGYFLDQQLAAVRVHGDNRYTSNQDNIQLKANIALLTAFHLRNKWPALATYTDCLFANGLGLAWKAKTVSPAAQQAIDHYSGASSAIANLSIRLRATYHYLRA